MKISDKIVVATSSIALIISLVSLYFSEFVGTDYVKAAFLTIHTEKPYSIDIALINSGNRQSLITDIAVSYTFNGRFIGMEEDQEIEPIIPIVLLPGDVKLFKIRMPFNLEELFEFWTSDEEPSCKIGDQDGIIENATRDVEISIYARLMDSYGIEHHKTIQNITICITKDSISSYGYSAGFIDLLYESHFLLRR